jgi:Skp family chaperone for outer membrane proteins
MLWVITVAANTLFANKAIAQEKANAGGKVGIVNLGKVLARYEKAIAFREGVLKSIKPLKDDMDQLRKDLEALAMLHEEAKSDAKLAGVIAEEMAAKKKRLEAMTLEAAKLVGKKQEEQVISLYKEVASAARRHAEKNGFVIVLGVGDPPNPQDLFAFPAVSRKLQVLDAGAMVPLYVHPSVDLTDALIAVLNEAYRKDKKDQPVDRDDDP